MRTPGIYSLNRATIEFSWKFGLSHHCALLPNTSRDLNITLYILPPGHGATLCLEEIWVTSHLLTALQEASYHEEFQQYIIQKTSWETKEFYDMVDWPAWQHAGLKLGPYQKITTFKLEFDILASHNEREKLVQTKNIWKMPILQ